MGNFTFEKETWAWRVIVANGGYANTRFITTLFRNPVSLVQITYPEATIRTQNPVEKQRRFPVLALGWRLSMARSMAVIVTCAVFHNICIDFDGGDEPPANPDIPAVVLDDIDDPSGDAGDSDEELTGEGTTLTPCRILPSFIRNVNL